jgi:hypothetical protein
MQDMAHAAGLRRPTETAPLEVPSSRLRLARRRTPLGRAPPRSRSNSSLEWSRPARGLTPPRTSLDSLEGPSHPRLGPATITGAPHECASPRTRAFNALTPRDGAIMRPGLTPRCRRTNSAGRRPSPPLWEGTVRYGRCQSRDTARPLQYG